MTVETKQIIERFHEGRTKGTRDYYMRTGRHIQHDEQSRNFEIARKVVKIHSVTHGLEAKALDQGDLGSCTGNAGGQWLNCAANVTARVKFNNKVFDGVRFQGRKYCTEDNAIQIYSGGTNYDDIPGAYPPLDTGGTSLGIGKYLSAIGVISAYHWTFDYKSFLSALMAGPVLLGINWYDEMFDPDGFGVIKIDGRLAGGHELLARGYDFRKKRVRLRNSWSPKWGIMGDCWIGDEDLEQLLIHEQGDAMVPVL